VEPLSPLKWGTVPIEKPDDLNVIVGQAHFIKTVEDVHEAIVTTNGSLKFGLAFCEASGPALVRTTGNDEALVALASSNAMRIGCGHAFILFVSGGFPINIMNALKSVSEVCTIHCATANPVEVIVAESERGRGIMGVIDGVSPRGVETAADAQTRKEFLRKIGYKAS
jgi:adenosine/AMP kinase